MVIWSPGSAGSAVCTKPLDSTVHAQSSSNSHSKENALRSSWIQRLRPISGTNIGGFREKKPNSTSSGVPSLAEVGEQQPRHWLDENAWSSIRSEVDSGKEKFVEQKAAEDSDIRNGCGSIRLGERASCSGSKALCMQNYTRSSQDEYTKESLQHRENLEPSNSRPERSYAGTASPLVHCQPHPVTGFDPALGGGMPVGLELFPPLTNFGSCHLAPPDQTDCNFAEQSGLRWAGYSPQFGAYNQGSAKPALGGPKYDYLSPDVRWRSVGPFGNPIKISCLNGKPGIESRLVQFPHLSSNSLAKLPYGLEGGPSPPHEMNEAAKDSRRFGKDCSSSSSWPMQGKPHMTIDQPLANDCRPSQSDLFFKKVPNSSGFGRYEGNFLGNCTTKLPENGSKMRQADKKAPIKAEAKRSTVFSSGSIEMKQRHNSGVGRAGHHNNQDEHMRRSPDPDNLVGSAMDGHGMDMKEGKAGFTEPLTFVEQLLGADRLIGEQGSDQAYVLTPIFAKTDPIFQSQKKTNIAALLNKGRPESVSVSIPTTSAFFTANGAKTNSKESGRPHHKSRESGQQKGLGFYLTSLKHSQRPATQVTSDSSTASLPKEFVGDLYRGTRSFDPEQHSEGFSHYEDVLRAKSSSSPIRRVKQLSSSNYQNYVQHLRNENVGLKQCDEHGSMAAPRNRLPESK